jgi:hypothetical protein
LMAVLPRRRNCSSFRRAFCRWLGVPPITGRRTHVILEHQSIAKRAIAIAMSEWFLQGWPARTISLCRVHGILATDLLRDFKRCPYWFDSAVRHELFKVYSPWRQHWHVRKKEIQSYTTFAKRRLKSVSSKGQICGADEKSSA